MPTAVPIRFRWLRALGNEGEVRGSLILAPVAAGCPAFGPALSTVSTVAHSLVIVESPAKAKKIKEYLGSDYTVESSIGHVRDLPRNASEVPQAYKGESWARIGIDVDNDFKAVYVTNADKRGHVRHLKSLLSEADELVLATDKDREGEAIAWHLLELLNPQVPVKRITFNEITREAIQRALANPGELNLKVVEAQETRRLLDRLYGYEVSPVLWRKVQQGTSAGRVQSVAVRIVVERERERMEFVSANYWDLIATFTADQAEVPFTAKILEVDGARVAGGKDFGSDGTLVAGRRELVHLDRSRAEGLAAAVGGRPAIVESREAKPYRRRPAAPFITSTYQQEAGRKLRLSAANAMRVAQGLYERGYITYMRTDSTTLSDEAVTAARSQIAERFGPDFLPDAPRVYRGKSKNAQEAHEAIRPAGDRFRTPEEVAGELSAQDYKVYELIWQRTVASQMTDATGETVTLRLGVDTVDSTHAVFSTSGTVIRHKGFLSVYQEGSDDDDNGDDIVEQRLPPLDEGDRAEVASAEAEGHDTQPPARYNEASLVKKLEELGVGRPSTYATIIQTIINREYVWKKGAALVPSILAFATVKLLTEHFPDLVDYAFTAQMEDDLDEIAEGGEERIPYLTRFYFGTESRPGLKAMVENKLDEIDPREINSIPLGVDADGRLVEARVGRYGPYLQRGEARASIPADVAPDELTVTKAVELIEAPQGDRQLGSHPESGEPVYVKSGRFGPYVQLGDRDDEAGTKPKMESLFKTMDPDTVTLDDALKLLSLPRQVGPDDKGQMIEARNGRYGPYVSRTVIDDDGNSKTDSRSLESEDHLFTVTVEEALALFAQPRRRRGQRQQQPAKALGTDPATDKPVELREGRFGPYVTDGETNASLRKGDDPETVTIERASELLADRRAAGPAKKRATKKRSNAKKRATTKRSTAKKSAKKTAKKVARKAGSTTPSEEDPF